MPHTIAIVEDDLDQQQNYADYLQLKGFVTHCFSNVQSALEGIPALQPDIVLLDVVLQEDNDGGFTLCRALLDQGLDLPIVFLTDRSEEIDQGFGLRIGAWDYQTKPLSLSLLYERLMHTMRLFKARRTPIDSTTSTAEKTNKDLELNREREYVKWKNTQVPLTSTEFRVFIAIVDAGEAGCSYDELSECTKQRIVGNGTINSHVKNVRQKFRKIDDSFDLISNKAGFGYCWVDQACAV